MHETLDEFLADGEFRDYMRSAFVDNECGTDEYRESQPEKGLAYIGELFILLRAGNRDPKQPILNNTFSTDVEIETHVLDLTQKWLAAMHKGYSEGEAYEGGWFVYAGNEELVPILQLYFDLVWLERRHPYAAPDEEDLLEYFMGEWHFWKEEQ